MAQVGARTHWRMLNLADVALFPSVFDPLSQLVEITSFSPSRALLLSRIPEFEIYFASLHVQADAEVLSLAERLRVIATPSTGLDHTDLDAAQPRGITVLFCCKCN